MQPGNALEGIGPDIIQFRSSASVGQHGALAVLLNQNHDRSGSSSTGGEDIHTGRLQLAHKQLPEAVGSDLADKPAAPTRLRSKYRDVCGTAAAAPIHPRWSVSTAPWFSSRPDNNVLDEISDAAQHVARIGVGAQLPSWLSLAGAR
jgi:hypothetical protein